MFKKFVKQNTLFSSFLLAHIALLLYKVVAYPTPFYDWDESLYIQTGKEMLHNHYFFFPVWQGIPWLDKPPLIPFVYGLVARLAFFTSPEISTRVFTVIIAAIVLTLLYLLFYKATKDKISATLGAVITAFTPIFLQRTQVVNLDIFLLLGWVGYALFYESTWAGLVFLLLAILSKSLIGFYAPALVILYLIYLFITKKLSKKDLLKSLKKVGVQVGVALSWFGAMLLIFKEQFWKLHIIESHFRRVTSSIEFHYGQRTFYIDLAREQLGLLFWVALVGLIIVLIKYFKKEKQLFYSLFLLPWFVFLNLTKTKIFWYFFAAIPQFGFLAAVPALLFAKSKRFYYVVLAIILGVFIYQSFIQTNVLATVYSKPEPYYELSLYARSTCSDMTVLMDKQTRDSFSDLDRQGLLITTTKWWGSHPSMVYYFEKHIDFIYDESEMVDKSIGLGSGSCVVVDLSDKELFAQATSYTHLSTFGTMELFVRN